MISKVTKKYSEMEKKSLQVWWGFLLFQLCHWSLRSYLVRSFYFFLHSVQKWIDTKHRIDLFNRNFFSSCYCLTTSRWEILSLIEIYFLSKPKKAWNKTLVSCWSDKSPIIICHYRRDRHSQWCPNIPSSVQRTKSWRLKTKTTGKFEISFSSMQSKRELNSF